MDFHKKKKIKKIIYSNTFLVALFLVVLLLLNATWNVYQDARFTENNLEKSEKELQKLSQRSEQLRHETEVLSTPEGIERQIREDLPLAKEGERVIILVEDDDVVEEENEEEESGFWQRIVNWIW